MSIIPSFFGRRNNDPFFSLDSWDPSREFPFSTSASSLALSRPEFSSETAQFANTRIDWKETPEAHVFKADLPGLKKEEVKVEVEEGKVLQISGERSKEKEEKNDQWHRVECSSGKFLRRFRLPENANVDGGEGWNGKWGLNCNCTKGGSEEARGQGNRNLYLNVMEMTECSSASVVTIYVFKVVLGYVVTVLVMFLLFIL